MRGKLMEQAPANKQGGPKGEPGLEFLIRFCISNHDEIFAVNIRRILEAWLNHKKFMDMVIHGKWMFATELTLKEIASHSRPLIQNILNGTTLKK